MLNALERQVQTLRHGIGCLIHSYAEGLIDKEQFEPRVRRLKERIALLEADAAKEAAALAEQQSLRLVMGQMDDFVATVKDRLSDLDWETRRAILRALVKRVEVDHTHIRVVFRVGPAPLVVQPDGTISQDRERSRTAGPCGTQNRRPPVPASRPPVAGVVRGASGARCSCWPTGRAAGHPRAWPAAQREGFRDDQPCRPCSALDVRNGDVSQALAEHSTGATRQRTAQTPDAHYKRDRAAAAGNIAEVPLVMAVDLLGIGAGTVGTAPHPGCWHR